jgi:hypothetical protein
MAATCRNLNVPQLGATGLKFRGARWSLFLITSDLIEPKRALKYFQELSI